MRRIGLRKSDDILLISTIIIAIILLIIQFMTPAAGGQLVVQIDGVKVASYSLEGSDGDFLLNDGTNTIRITDNKVKMIASDCPDQICVHHKEISKNNETIVCLPNKVVLIIENDTEDAIDASTN